MKKAKASAIGFGKLSPIGASLIQKYESSLDVRANERARRSNGTIDVALSGEVDDGARLMVVKERAHKLGVADVAALDARMLARVALEDDAGVLPGDG